MKSNKDFLRHIICVVGVAGRDECPAADPALDALDQALKGMVIT
jgi:hypothetical protein